jgi:flagellar basal body-associated protein FliL
LVLRRLFGLETQIRFRDDKTVDYSIAWPSSGFLEKDASLQVTDKPANKPPAVIDDWDSLPVDPNADDWDDPVPEADSVSPAEKSSVGKQESSEDAPPEKSADVSWLLNNPVLESGLGQGPRASGRTPSPSRPAEKASSARPSPPASDLADASADASYDSLDDASSDSSPDSSWPDLDGDLSSALDLKDHKAIGSAGSDDDWLSSAADDESRTPESVRDQSANAARADLASDYSGLASKEPPDETDWGDDFPEDEELSSGNSFNEAAEDSFDAAAADPFGGAANAFGGATDASDEEEADLPGDSADEAEDQSSASSPDESEWSRTTRSGSRRDSATADLADVGEADITDDIAGGADESSFSKVKADGGQVELDETSDASMDRLSSDPLSSDRLSSADDDDKPVAAESDRSSSRPSFLNSETDQSRADFLKSLMDGDGDAIPQKVELDLDGIFDQARKEADQLSPDATHPPIQAPVEETPPPAAPEEIIDVSPLNSGGSVKKVARVKMFILVATVSVIVLGLGFAIYGIFFANRPTPLPPARVIEADSLNATRVLIPGELPLDRFTITLDEVLPPVVVEMDVILHYHDYEDESVIKSRLYMIRDLIFRLTKAEGQPILTDPERRARFQADLLTTLNNIEELRSDSENPRLTYVQIGLLRQR